MTARARCFRNSQAGLIESMFSFVTWTAGNTTLGGTFSPFRILRCLRDDTWLVTVNHRHVATASSFDEAIRTAKARSGFTPM